MRRILFLSIVGLSLSLGACQERKTADEVTSKEVREKAADAMNTAADYAKQEKDQYIANAQKELDEAKGDLTKLKDKAKSATAKAKVELDRDAEVAEAKWKVAEQKLSELKAAGAESWKNFRADVDKAVDDVKQFFQKRK